MNTNVNFTGLATKRKDVFESLTEDPFKYFDKELLFSGGSLARRVQKAASGESAKEAVDHGRPANIAIDFLESTGFSPVAFRGNSSSPLSELKTDAQKLMFWELVEMIPRRQLTHTMRNKSRTITKADGTLTSIDPGSVLRPYDELDFAVPMLTVVPTLADIIGMITPSASLAGDIPQYDMPKEQEKFVRMAARAPYATVSLQLSDDKVPMYKSGFGAEVDEVTRTSPYGSQGFLELINRASQRLERALVAEALKVAYDFAVAEGNRNTTAVDVSTSDGAETFLTRFDEGNVADIVVGLNRAKVLDYIRGTSRTGVTYSRDEMGTGMVMVSNPNVELMNMTSRTLRAAWLEDTTVDGLHNDDLMQLDSMYSLGMLTYTGGMYDRMNFDAQRAVEQRFMGMWYGFYMQTQDSPAYVQRAA